MKNNTFKPTEEMIKAAKLVFLAMAHVQTVRPVVEGYQREILADISPINRYNGKVITDLKQSYCMSDKDFAEYMRRSKVDQDRNGFVVPPDFCPLLMAEHAQQKAEWLLIDAVAPSLGVKPDLITSTLDGYKKFIDLTLRMLAPLVGESADILKEFEIIK